MPTQNVNLTEALDSFVKKQVSSGYFNNASEVHRAALSLMARQEEERNLRLAKLRQDIETGDRDIELGNTFEYESADELMADLTR